MVDMHFTTYEVTVLKLILCSGIFHNQLESQPSVQLLIASRIPDHKELMASHSKSMITCLYYSVIVIH